MTAGARAGLATALVTGWGLFAGLGLAVMAQGAGGLALRVLLPLLAMATGVVLAVADHRRSLGRAAAAGMAVLLMLLPAYALLVWRGLFA